MTLPDISLGLLGSPLTIIASAAGIVAVWWLWNRIATFAITCRARAWTPMASRWLSRLAGANDYTSDNFFAADGADEQTVARRRTALEQLAGVIGNQAPLSRAWSVQAREGFSDLRFTDANRVPFPFVRQMRERFDLAAVVTASNGPLLRDLDGNWSLDVSGSYGVNVAGFDRYKSWIERGWQRVRDLGPVLGPLHPVVAENIALLKTISGHDEVSFHMSGTEAVMAAVRLARFNTGRRLIVTFAGAYHGWWDGVVPGLGSDRRIDDCLALKDLDRASLAVIRRRRHEIAAVLVNPVQSFHPNTPPPNDALLLTSDVRHAADPNQRYRAWLGELREVCTAAGVPLVLDEVYTGFRLAPGGAQQYFGVKADMVVYGKTVAGGLPIGVVCGPRALMRRFDPARPMRLSYVVGTFSAHPAVMGAMREFLEWVRTPETAGRYREMNGRFATWVQGVNRALAAAALPLRVMHLGTIWTVLFSEPGRYNWLLQYYLRAEGLTLSWVGTGRCLASMDFTPAHYDSLRRALLAAGQAMRRDGWWLDASAHPERDTHMQKQLRREIAGSLLQTPAWLKSFHAEVMRRKHDDHHASHHDKANQLLHLLSSSAFIYCYFIVFSDLTTAMCLGLISLFVRQFGHAILEPPCHDEEETLLGYNTRNKTLIVLGYTVIPLIQLWRSGHWSWAGFVEALPVIAQHWFAWTVAVVVGRVLYLAWTHDVRTSLIWYVKLVTDPITDIITYFPRRPQRA